MAEANQLRPSVLAALLAHGVRPREGDTPESLRERVNEVYLIEVRRLRERQRAGQIAKGDYAAQVAALKDRFSVLGLPTALWLE